MGLTAEPCTDSEGVGDEEEAKEVASVTAVEGTESSVTEELDKRGGEPISGEGDLEAA